MCEANKWLNSFFAIDRTSSVQSLRFESSIFNQFKVNCSVTSFMFLKTVTEGGSRIVQ